MHMTTPEQLTYGIGRQDYPALGSDGSIAFSSLTEKSELWSVPLGADPSSAAGAPQRLTSGAANRVGAAVSLDGARIAYLSNANGNNDVWVKDLRAGRETAVTATRDEEAGVSLSPDGSTLVFGYYSSNRLMVARLDGSGVREICADCGSPRGFFPAGDALLYQRTLGPSEWMIGVAELSGKSSALYRSSELALFSATVARDGKWLAVVGRRPPAEHRALAIPLRDGKLAPSAEWVSLTEPGAWIDKPRWSPGGDVVYFVSDVDGYVCLWSRSVDPATKRPAGPSKPLAHFHEGRSSIGSVYGLDLAAARDKLVFNVGEEVGNIWIARGER
jgi:Tol biopolymer transport system component